MLRFSLEASSVLEKIFKGFYHIWAWWPSWSKDHDHFSNLLFPQPNEAQSEIWAKLVQRRCHLKILTDGTNDRQKVITIAHPEHSSGELKITRQSEGWLYPPPPPPPPPPRRIKWTQTGGLQMWPWPWVCMVELWVLHIISLSWTFDPNLIYTFQSVQEIWSEHEIQGSNLWPWLCVGMLELWVLHIASLRQTFDQFHENLSKGSGDMEWTRKRWMTFNCDLDLESASLSYRFYTSSH